VLYWLEVYALFAAPVFAVAGVLIVSLLVWREGKAYAAARYRIYRRLSGLVARPLFFTNSLVISRTFSRSGRKAAPGSHNIPTS